MKIREPLTVDEAPIASLRPDPKNARLHPRGQIAQLKKAFARFGVINPVWADEDNTIIAGHGRLIAAKELGLKSIPVIRIAGLSATEKRALALADNKIPQGAAWDIDLVREHLVEIIADPTIDIEATGFSVGRVDAILSETAADPAEEIVPAAPKNPVTRPGDIWRVGPHRIGCGDAGDRAFLDRLADGEAVGAAFLDPPYNVRIDGHAGGKGRVRHREFAMASGEMSEAQFTDFLTRTLAAAAGVSKDGAIHFVCMDHRHIGEIHAAIEAVYDAQLNVCVWRKSNAGMGSLYRSQHELIFVLKVGEAPHCNNVELGRHGRNRTNVWDYPSVNSFKGGRRHDLALHPTVKPVSLVADALMDVTRPGDLVLDTFLGSGTTLIACERIGRRFCGLDLDSVYVDLALLRFRDLTGIEPTLETGETYGEVRRQRAPAREEA